MSKLFFNEDAKLSTSFLRANNTDGHNKLPRSVWTSCRNRVHNYIKFMRTRSGYVQSISADSVGGVSSGVQWYNNTKSFFNMLGSVWFSNLDIMVNNIRYLHDDGNKLEQPNIANKSDKSNESKQCDKSTNELNHNCTNDLCRICNGTGSDCANNDGDHNRVEWDYVKIRKSIWEQQSTSSKRYYDDVGYR